MSVLVSYELLWDQSFVLTLLWWFGLFGSVYADLIVLESLQGQRRPILAVGVTNADGRAAAAVHHTHSGGNAPLPISFGGTRIIPNNC